MRYRCLRRTALLLLVAASTVSGAWAQSGVADPEFAKVPFDQWMDGGGQAQIKWSARIWPATLSTFQRLTARVEIRVDGAELVRRRGKGQVLIFVQINDEAGAAWQDHGTIELHSIEDGMRAQDVVYTESAYVVPGDYRVSIAILFTDTGEHAVRKEKMHVAPLKNDPLPQAWRDMPRVEFHPSLDPPDSWYEPGSTARLHLPLAVERPIRIGVLVNLTPSEETTGPRRSQDTVMRALMPALKAVAQIEGSRVSIDIALLDLARRRVVFQQELTGALDWTAMKAALPQAEPGTIDVKALADRRQDAPFFVAEVARRVDPAQSAQPADVLIVLTGSMTFDRGEDLKPIRIIPKPNCRVFYLRFARPHARSVTGRTSVRGRMEPVETEPNIQARRPELDQLASTLRPLSPRVFDVDQPEQFRKDLATMLAEIARL